MSKCDLQKKESMRADNRSAFPATAKIMDEFRAAFGADMKLVYAEENGRTIGKKLPAPKRFMTGSDWARCDGLIAAELVRRAQKPPFRSLSRGERK